MSFTVIENYNDLKASIADYLDRNDLVVQIPGFIQLCEANINRVLRHHDTICRGQSVGWRQDVFIPLPDNWLEGINFKVVLAKENPDVPGEYIDGDEYQLTYQSKDALDQLKLDNPQWRPRADMAEEETGEPRQPIKAGHFTYHGRTVEIWPDPSQQFRLELDYYEGVSALSDANPTNTVLTKYPDLYLYGSLIHSAPFLRDDPRTAIWSKLFTTANDQLLAASEKAMTSGSRLTRKTNVRMG